MDEINVSDVVSLSSQRAGFYQFLASLLKDELTDDQLEALSRQGLPVAGGPLDEGIRLVNSYVEHRDDATRQQLAVDFAHVFLGAGHYKTITAPPYESVFTSPQQLLMQDARDDVVRHYRQAGFDVSADAHAPEDHISFEFQFMAQLIERMDRAAAAADDAAAAEAAARQIDFFRAHVTNWVPLFCEAVENHACTDFYRGVAKMVRGFVAWEAEAVNALTVLVPDADGVVAADIAAAR